MEILTVEAQKREKAGSRASRALRKEGMVPAVVYGHGGESYALAMPLKPLVMGLRQNARILTLNIGDSSEKVMIKDLQWDVFGDHILHLDLVRISMDEEISMSVSLVTKGRAAGVEEGGILEMQRNEMRIKCLPTQIPDELVIDVSELEVGSSLHIKDVPLPEGVILDDDPEQTVAAIVTRVEIEEPEVEEEGEEGAEEGEPAEGEEKKDADPDKGSSD